MDQHWQWSWKSEIIIEQNIHSEKLSQNGEKKMWLMIVTKRNLIKKPLSTKQMLEALQVLRRGIQQRDNFDVFDKYKAYDEIIMKLTEEGKIQLILDGFLLKIN